MSKKVLLMILDGWGIASDKEASAPDQANTPFIDSCYEKYPNCRIKANGVAVGVPEGQMGNSEVGHIHIGSGRVVYQELVKINMAIEDKTLHNHEILLKSLKQAKEKGKQMHFMGLVSDGGIHSHINHLKALCDIAAGNEIEKLFIHAFTDGRDTDPKSGTGFIKELQGHLDKTTGQIATVTGRYYAMDRDNQWDRIKVAYEALLEGKGTKTNDLIKTMKEKYDKDETDEFIKPIIKTKKDSDEPLTTLQEGDMVVFFNFRTDRGRQLTHALTQEDMEAQGMHTLDLDYLTMTNYDDSFEGIKVIFKKDNLENTLGEVVSKAGKKQIRIAETQKYPHVTYFLSGGREKEFEGEERIMLKSSNVATYDQNPEMSAYEVKDKIIPKLKEQQTDFICLNFANLDMVGHTGVFEAAKKACEAVDECAKEVAKTAVENGYAVIITADHGNSEFMKNEDGSPNTAHTTNPVPLFLLNGPENIKLHDGKLTDLAPTILKLMDIEPPEEMSGEVLFE
ncbi:MAG: 2,3-bisphosphoglycerate-independent phosphoglycerate mutase [Bacteroidota bacterium]|nr:2,3-bisphosphoglycerate-independent phosphoglycerate mutase [Bacteroidota bacterium]